MLIAATYCWLQELLIMPYECGATLSFFGVFMRPSSKSKPIPAISICSSIEAANYSKPIDLSQINSLGGGKFKDAYTFFSPDGKQYVFLVPRYEKRSPAGELLPPANFDAEISDRRRLETLEAESQYLQQPRGYLKIELPVNDNDKVKAAPGFDTGTGAVDTSVISRDTACMVVPCYIYQFSNSSDEEIRELVEKYFLETGRILVDAYVIGNVMEFKIVDADWALRSQKISVDKGVQIPGEARPGTPSSEINDRASSLKSSLVKDYESKPRLEASNNRINHKTIIFLYCLLTVEQNIGEVHISKKEYNKLAKILEAVFCDSHDQSEQFKKIDSIAQLIINQPQDLPDVLGALLEVKANLQQKHDNRCCLFACLCSYNILKKIQVCDTLLQIVYSGSLPGSQDVQNFMRDFGDPKGDEERRLFDLLQSLSASQVAVFEGPPLGGGNMTQPLLR